MQQASKIGERIALARKRISLTQQEFADKAKVNRAYLGNIEQGRREASLSFISAICEAHRINADWLLTGEGPMYRQPQAANDGPETAPPLSEPKKRLLELYDALDKEGQEQVRGCAEDQKRMQDLEKELQALKKKVGT